MHTGSELVDCATNNQGTWQAHQYVSVTAEMPCQATADNLDGGVVNAFAPGLSCGGADLSNSVSFDFDGNDSSSTGLHIESDDATHNGADVSRWVEEKILKKKF